MTKPRHSEHHAKIHQEKAYHRVAGTKGHAGPAPAGMAAYREEYQRDNGPDLDEALDRTESGDEF